MWNWKRNILLPIAFSGFMMAGLMYSMWYSRSRIYSGPPAMLTDSAITSMLTDSAITSLYAWLGTISLMFALSFLNLGRMLTFTSDPPEDPNIPKLIDEQAERIKQLEAQVAWLNARLGPPST